MTTIALPALAPATGDTPTPIADTTLSTGLRVVVARMPAVPMVQIRLGIPFGGPGTTGAAAHAARAEVLAASLLTGTTRRERATIDETIAANGGTLKVTVGPELLRIVGQVLSDGLDPILDLLAEVLTGAAYPSEAVAAEARRVLDRIRLADASPAYAARSALLRHCFPGHPLSWEIPGAAEVAAVAHAEVVALHEAQVAPRGAMLVLAGDIDPERAVARIADAFGGWNTGRTARRMLPAPPIAAHGLLTVDRPGARQTEIRLAGDAPGRTDPDFAAAHLATAVLGGFFSARLVQNLRERLGLVYAGHAVIEQRAGRGITSMQLAAAPANAAAVAEETLAELDRISTSAPPEAAEIAAARGHALGVHAIGLSTQVGLADAVFDAVGAGLDPDWPQRQAALVRAVTDDEVRRAAATYLRPSEVTGIVFGSAA